ncbi:MAG: hypothetical protein ACLR1T_14215 [Evtepia gabavorous]
MESLDEVLRIQTEGTQKRREAEAELGRIEGELKQKLLALRTDPSAPLWGACFLPAHRLRRRR